MWTRQTTSDGERTRPSKEPTQHGPGKRGSNPDDFGQMILFVMLVLIVLALAAIMSAAVHETVYFIREVLAP